MAQETNTLISLFHSDISTNVDKVANMETRFLVLGSNSFSGSHFCDYLIKSGIPVLATSRSRENQPAFLPYMWCGKNSNFFAFEQLDINKDLERLQLILDKFQPTHIVNFAAQSMVAESWLYPLDWVQTNITATTNILELLRTYKRMRKFVQVTTPEVYGSTDTIIDEKNSFNPSTPYAVSRAAGDMMFRVYFEQYNLPICFTRAANVYGPGQQLYRIIPRTVLSCLSGQKLTLDGGGLSKRSFVHIEDVCSATFNVAMTGKIGETYHISNNEFVTIRECVQLILNTLGKDFDDVVEIGPERAGKDLNYFLNSSKIRTELGWKDQICLADGVGQVVDWVASNIDSLKKM